MALCAKLTRPFIPKLTRVRHCDGAHDNAQSVIITRADIHQSRHASRARLRARKVHATLPPRAQPKIITAHLDVMCAIATHLHQDSPPLTPLAASVARTPHPPRPARTPHPARAARTPPTTRARRTPHRSAPVARTRPRPRPSRPRRTPRHRRTATAAVASAWAHRTHRTTRRTPSRRASCVRRVLAARARAIHHHFIHRRRPLDGTHKKYPYVSPPHHPTLRRYWSPLKELLFAFTLLKIQMVRYIFFLSHGTQYVNQYTM